MMKGKNVKTAIPALVLATALTGCGAQTKTNTTEAMTEASTQITTETMTEATTQAATEAEPAVAHIVTDYEKYEEFYDVYGITEEELVNIGKVLNEDVTDLTKKEVSDACENIKTILLPQYIVDSCGHIRNEELGFIEIEGQFNLLEPSSLLQYTTDYETQEILEKYETLRARVINDINTTNKVSDETKEALINAVVEMEEEYIITKEDMNNDTSNDGQIFLKNWTKKKLIDLTVNAAGVDKVESKKLGTLYLLPQTPEEIEIYSIALTKGLDALTDEQKLIYQNIILYKIDEKYINCGAEQNLLTGAKDNNDYSKEELINIKQYLLIQKEEAKYYTYSL